jgi:hypothetical protein
LFFSTKSACLSARNSRATAGGSSIGLRGIRGSIGAKSLAPKVAKLSPKGRPQRAGWYR